MSSSKKAIKHVHRLVVLPDYQGIGMGIKLLEFIGNMILKKNNRYIIVTSQPALINSLKKNQNWRCIRFGRAHQQTSQKMNRNNSAKRITGSFEYFGKSDQATSLK